jgi:hypothetical protein
MANSLDIVNVWYSAIVKLPNGLFMFIIYYYNTRHQNKKENFYKCNFRIDSLENWVSLLNEIAKNNPAEDFRTSLLGMDDDYRLFYRTKVLNNFDFSKWIKEKFKYNRIVSWDEFINKALPSYYLRAYKNNDEIIDITNYEKIPTQKWFCTFRESKPRKKYGNLIF